jgi:hypothetical protein
MKKSQLILALTYATLSVSQLSGQAQCPGTVSTVRYHSSGNSQLTIPVTINHAGPYEFLLDTGAQISIVEPSLAEELQLKPRGEINVISVAANAAAQLVSLDLVEVGSAAVSQQIAAVQSMAQLQKINPRIRGLLGGNFLAHFDLLLDYGHKLLCLDNSDQLRQAIQGEHVPMANWNSSPSASSIPDPILIAARLPDDRTKSTILKLDSGTNAPVLFTASLEKPVGSTPGSQAVRGAVTGGSAQSFVMLPVKDVQIGPHTWVEVRFVAPENKTEHTGRTGMDGLLPTQLFKRILISYSAGYVVFNPR